MDSAGYTCDVEAEQPNAEGQVVAQDVEA
jgi:hypothetical protein